MPPFYPVCMLHLAGDLILNIFPSLSCMSFLKTDVLNIFEVCDGLLQWNIKRTEEGSGSAELHAMPNPCVVVGFFLKICISVNEAESNE